MSLDLYIPPCTLNPAHPNHPPPLDKPLRIQIQGPLESIQKVLPDLPWHTNHRSRSFPQPAAPKLASATYQALYGTQGGSSNLIVRDEYMAWVMEGGRALE